MNTNIVMAVLVVALLLLSVVQAIEIARISGVSNSAYSTSADASGSGGETYQQMMERMHGSSAGNSQGSSSPQDTSPSMVGGC